MSATPDRPSFVALANCGYCRDCKWWENEIPTYEQERTAGLGHCLKAELEYPETKAMAMHQHDEPALVTAPDFGCVQFEAKYGVTAVEKREFSQAEICRMYGASMEVVAALEKTIGYRWWKV